MFSFKELRNFPEEPVGFGQKRPLNSEWATCVPCYCKPLSFCLKLDKIVYFASDLAVFSFERRWWYWRFNVLSWLSSSSLFSLEAMLQAPLMAAWIFSRGYFSHVFSFSPSGPGYAVPSARNVTLHCRLGLSVWGFKWVFFTCWHGLFKLSQCGLTSSPLDSENDRAILLHQGFAKLYGNIISAGPSMQLPDADCIGDGLWGFGGDFHP